MSYEIREKFCPICGDEFIRIINNRAKFLPNHWQYQVEFKNGQKANFAVCKKHQGKLKKKDHEDLLEAHKKFWDNEIERNPKVKNKEKEKEIYNNLSFKKVYF